MFKGRTIYRVFSSYGDPVARVQFVLHPSLRSASSVQTGRSSVDSQTLESRLNAPTTLPPPLDSPPPRLKHEYAIQHYIKVGKTYLRFYKTAAKQILSNRKTAKLVRARFPDHPFLKPFPGDAIDHKTGQLVVMHSSKEGQGLSRAEFQLVRRLSHDMKKVPVFILLLAIFGEWLPLFVVFLDPLLPRSVLLPAQVLKRRRKAVKAVEKEGADLDLPPKSRLEGAGIHDRAQLLLVARRYGLLGPVSQFFQATSLLRRVRRHESYVALDDILLRNDLQAAGNGPPSLEGLCDVELDQALEDRGLWQENQTEQNRRAVLHKWLEHESDSRNA